MSDPSAAGPSAGQASATTSSSGGAAQPQQVVMHVPQGAVASPVTAHSLEHFITIGQNLSGSATFTSLVEFINRSSGLLHQNVAKLDTVMETLDMHDHTLPLMAVLSAQLAHGTIISNWDDLFGRVVLFLKEANTEHLCYDVEGYAQLCHRFTDELIRRNVAIQGLSPLLAALPRIQRGFRHHVSVSESCLTSVHSDICKLCLAGKCFGPALDLMKIDLTDIAQEAIANDPKYILSYFYYGGMIQAAVKDFPRALFFLELCLTTPTNTVSHIMLEAYKKYLLIWLLQPGYKPKEAQSLPKYTSSVVSKYLKPLCAPYHDIVTNFVNNQLEDLRKTISRHSSVFTADQNAGLVAQVEENLIKMSVRRLTRTFVTLTLSELAERIGLNSPRDAERLIVNMIEEGSINAKICHKDGMVRFESTPEHCNSDSLLNELEFNIGQVIQLDKKVQMLDEEILTNAKYMKKHMNLPVAMKDVSASGSSSLRAEEDDGFEGGLSSTPRRGMIFQ